MPLVSVIMPSYNHQSYISEAIQSVLNQSIEDLELIIIDDSSNDKSREIIKDFKKDNRIKTIFHKENMGIARTINDGIEHANGKYIAFIASDDLWMDYKLEKQLNILKKDESLIVWSEGMIINDKGEFTCKKFTQMYPSDKKSGNLFEYLIKSNYIFVSSLIFKNDTAKKIKVNENLKYLNDQKFNIDLSYKYKYLFIDEPLAKYRLHSTNSISSDAKGWYNDILLLNKRIIEKYGNEISNKKKCDMIRTSSLNLISTALKNHSWKNLIYVILPLINLYVLIIKFKLQNDVYRII